MKEDFEILNMDYLSALENFAKKNVKFDLVFLDPPYKAGFLITALEKLNELDLLSNGSVVVVEHEFENDLQNLPKCYIIEKSKKYGIAYVDIISKLE